MQPSAKTLKIIQDKYVQKEHMSKQDGVALGPYKKITCAKDVEDLGAEWGWPVMLKSRLGAYDGKGNAAVRGPGDIAEAFKVRTRSCSSPSILFSHLPFPL